MNKILPVIALSIASLLTSCVCHGNKITLADKGKPAATIVLQKAAPAKMKAAAVNLQKYIKKISGATLELKEDGAAVQGTGLYIGKCDPTMDSDFPAKSLNPETYAITVRDNGIFFTGNYPTPTAFAVYSFIEEDLGVRWYAPGDLWEKVPTAKDGILTAQVKSRVVVPGTSPRIWSGHDWAPSWVDWNIRNKTVLSEVVPMRQFQNRVHDIFPPEKYAKTHPEYYPLCNGKRYIPTKGDKYWRPCEGNPEVQKVVVDYINDFFDKHPETDSFSLGMDDISRLCSCPLCLAMDPSPDSYANRKFSDRHYKFVNIIAKEVAKKHPDKYIGTLIYNIALELPETVQKLEPNVFGYMTETSAYWWNPGQMKYDHDLTAAWRKRISHISRYDYYGFASMAPRYYPHFVDEQMKFDKKLGLEGMYIEVYTFLPLTMPMIWQTSKLQWDASLNTDKLLDDFMNIYGDAKPVMAEFWNFLESTYAENRPNRGKWEHRHIRNMATSITIEQLDKAIAILDKALAVTNDPNVKKRINIHRDALRLTEYIVRPFSITSKAMFTKVESKESANKIFAMAEELKKTTKGREEFLESLTKRDDLLGLNYIGLTQKINYMPISDFQTLESGMTTAIISALSWYAKNSPGEMGKVSAGFKRDGSNLGEIVNAYTSITSDKSLLKNLIINGTFDNKEESKDQAPLDWENGGAPVGWYSWTNTHGMIIKPAPGKTNNAISISNSRGNGVIIQRVPVNAGEILLLNTWIKGKGKGSASITCRFQTPEGKWHPERNLEPGLSIPSNQIGDWQPIAMLIKIPEGAGKAVIMLGASSQKSKEDVVFYDDVEIYKTK